MNIKSCLAALLVVASAANVYAQSSIPKKQPIPAENVYIRSDKTASGWMKSNFFTLESVMRHQSAIGLTEEQQKNLRADANKTMERFTDLQWQESAATEAMLTLTGKDHPDEKAALAQFNKLLAIEDEMKRLQAGLLVRIKNTLTPEQQAKLREIENQEKSAMPVPGKKTLY